MVAVHCVLCKVSCQYSFCWVLQLVWLAAVHVVIFVRTFVLSDVRVRYSLHILALECRTSMC